MDQFPHWVHTWTAMPMRAEPDNLPPKAFIQDGIIFPNTTLRQTLKITLGTERYLRLRFSNAFGTNDLTITQTAIALASNNSSGTSDIDSDTLQKVTFDGGLEKTTIPVSAQAVSDPIDFGVPLPAHTVLSVSLFLEGGHDGEDGITLHPGSRTTSFCAFGNQVPERTLTDPSVEEVEHWYYISGVEVLADRESCALAIIGDSITDGMHSTTNGNNRWPDLLFPRLQSNPITSSISILNQAAGGNRILADGLGPNVLSRLDRDIISHSGVQYVLIFEGVNDIGVAEANEESQRIIGDRLIAAYTQIATRVHARGIPIFAATITPFGRRKGEIVIDADAEGFSPYSHPLREVTRQRINEWIRRTEVFDAIVDFDKILRDKDDTSVLAKEFDSGDRLHPNAKAFKALADAFPLHIFGSFNFAKFN
ncbi:hypothetical protein N7474_008238 [Penicillium riverlandense]|uniref:uncharacterized protein n=1 Tax=Penicillium riverlandense TaxID=1903569 RepID=UPI002547BA2E|nr:uncharacterized protein N7474_008238 [Penicillium riverlandense]KAJ5811937.1 hypothetical protein N7474_008238 [Penicillium riverlandense]